MTIKTIITATTAEAVSNSFQTRCFKNNDKTLPYQAVIICFGLTGTETVKLMIKNQLENWVDYTGCPFLSADNPTLYITDIEGEFKVKKSVTASSIGVAIKYDYDKGEPA
jgi:hypothetical protein